MSFWIGLSYPRMMFINRWRWLVWRVGGYPLVIDISLRWRPWDMLPHESRKKYSKITNIRANGEMLPTFLRSGPFPDIWLANKNSEIRMPMKTRTIENNKLIIKTILGLSMTCNGLKWLLDVWNINQNFLVGTQSFLINCSKEYTLWQYRIQTQLYHKLWIK